jgi:hypothetical protein
VLAGAWVSTGPAGAAASTTTSTLPGAPQGNAVPNVKPASGVAVVAQSSPVDGRVALLLHNGTAKPVRVDGIVAVATSSEGGAAVRARAAKSYPQVVAPDQLALASVQFRAKALIPGATITTKVRSTPVTSARAQRVLSVGDLALSPPMTGSVAQTLAARLTNPTSSWTAHRPEVAVVCFGEASNPSTFAAAPVSARRVKPGKSVATTVPLTSLCPTYLVAARAS